MIRGERREKYGMTVGATRTTEMLVLQKNRMLQDKNAYLTHAESYKRWGGRKKKEERSTGVF